MKTHLWRNMFIVGPAALVLAASAVALPSVADAANSGMRPHAQSHGRVGANYNGRGYSGYRGSRGYGGYYGGGYYGGGYYGGFCGPIQLTLGLCGPWGY